MENSITKYPYDKNSKEDLISIFKNIIKGTFLDQNIIPFTNNPLKVTEFSCYITNQYHSIEIGLLHEIAHAIQLKKEKYKNLKNNSFFYQPKSSTNVILGKKYYEPISNEPTINECETFAIQLVLLEFLGYEINHETFFQEVADLLDCGALPDFSKNRKEMCLLFCKGFYFSWKDKLYLIEKRFQNYCKYISSMKEYNV